MTRPGSSRYFDVAPTDRAMAALYEGSRFAPQLEFEFDTVLDDEQLQRALVLLAQRHPILGATADLTGSRAVWRPDTTTPAFVHAVEDAELDPRDGPTCRLVHLRDGSKSRLQLGIHHGIADGRSLVILIDDLRAFYLALTAGARPVVDIDWTDRTVDALLDERGAGFADRVRMGWDAARRWAESRPSTHRDDDVSSRLDAVPEPERGPSVRFERAQLEAIQTVGATRGWRRNHVLLAILARAWLDVVGHAPASPSVSGWQVTVDGRRQFHTTRGVGNLSGMAPVSIVGLESISVPDTVDAVGRAFASLARPGAGMVADVGLPGSGIAPGTLVDRAVRDTVEAWDTAFRYTRFFSHLDPLADSLADWGDAEMLGVRWCQSAPAAPHVAMMLVTFRGTTTLTIVASPVALAAERVRALQDRASELLRELAEEMSGSRVG